MQSDAPESEKHFKEAMSVRHWLPFGPATGGSMESKTVVIAKPQNNRLIFNVPAGSVLIIEPDGRIVRGEAFASDDAASVAFFDCIASHFATAISDLKRRAEAAEAKVDDILQNMEGR